VIVRTGRELTACPTICALAPASKRKTNAFSKRCGIPRPHEGRAARKNTVAHVAAPHGWASSLFSASRLIGGSLPSALKKRKSVARVVGVGRSRANLLARGAWASSTKSRPILRWRAGRGLVLLAVPLGQTAAVLAQIAPHLAGRRS